ncbi:hypothetical protein [Flavobacterium pectinovorum]|uniref:Uncharacterized protein n=1 Tax=Flavobacterium pectinovorum TaxID=29533 RepID=A0AB36P2Y9_9FLAO|nr:hypothetical protein [Flavobacterium pectinovorum]OXB04334.1 hypothetical protein B0A72_12600 [Flavobacterium pectinovorum]SHL54490.1 hypothetical protein SAMN05444387_0866 [Flavobacterium pectinovorum]
MKNLFLTCAMIMFLGSAAMAQDTQKKKQSKSTTDTTTVQKTNKKSTTTYKNDPAHKEHTDKSKTTSPSTPNSTIPRDTTKPGYGTGSGSDGGVGTGTDTKKKP